MKKTYKHLALILSLLTLVSQVGVVGAVKPKNKGAIEPKHRTKTCSDHCPVYDYTLNQELRFKGELLASPMRVETEMGNTFITKSMISSQNAREMRKTRDTFDSILRLASVSYVSRGRKLDKELYGDFDSLCTILTATSVRTKNKVEKKDIINLLCVAQRKGIEIPDLINFDCVNMYCNGKSAIVSLKKDGRQVFGFLIPID